MKVKLPAMNLGKTRVHAAGGGITSPYDSLPYEAVFVISMRSNNEPWTLTLREVDVRYLQGKMTEWLDKIASREVVAEPPRQQ